MKIAGSNILTRKQLKRMTNNYLTEFAMKNLVLLTLNLMSLKSKMKSSQQTTKILMRK